MRSKKSLFSYLLYLFVCLTVFSGCGESEEEFLLTEENVAAESEQEEAEEESESKSQDESYRSVWTYAGRWRIRGFIF